MKEVKVNKQELLAALKDNKDKHVQDYETAHLIWRDDQIDAIEEEIEAVKKDRDGRIDYLERARSKMVDWDVDSSSFANYQGGQEPETHEQDYNAAIAMLEMSLDDETTIENRTFQQLVMDVWDWKEQFQAVTMSYLSGPKGCSGHRGASGDAGLTLRHIEGNK